MNTLIFLLYAVIFACVWYVFNQYFKDHSNEMIHPIRKNMGVNLQKWKEHFLGGDDKNVSMTDIKDMVKKAMDQITNETSMKPVIEETNMIKTDMELYLIGPNKNDFYKNLQKSRQVPTQVKTNTNITDMDFYLGTSKKENNSIVNLLKV